jgi:hypothetical protein
MRQCGFHRTAHGVCPLDAVPRTGRLFPDPIPVGDIAAGDSPRGEPKWDPDSIPKRRYLLRRTS